MSVKDVLVRQMLLKVGELLSWSFRCGKGRVSDDYFLEVKQKSLDDLKLWLEKVLQ